LLITNDAKKLLATRVCDTMADIAPQTANDFCYKVM